MRVVWLIGWLALASACASHSVRCDKHLRAINVPNPAAVAPKASASHP
jgi:hypothetical protein